MLIDNRFNSHDMAFSRFNRFAYFFDALERPLPDGPLALCPAGAFLNPDFLPNDFTSFALLHDFNVKLATHRAYMN